MKVLALRKADQNDALVDPWTPVHFGAGLAAGLLGISPWWSLAAAVAYEAAEQAAERTGVGQRVFGTSGPESLGNAIVDVLVFMGGRHLGAKYNGT